MMKTLSKITRNKDFKAFEIDCKRFYLPYTIEVACEKCGEKITQDLSQQYLGYPQMGKPFDHYFWCEECDHEFSREMELEISITINETKVEND